MSFQQPYTVQPGQRFGRLVTVRWFRKPSGKLKKIYWECRCDCGKTKDVRACDLKLHPDPSCGCTLREGQKRGYVRHGLSDTPEYAIWCEMKDRCNNNPRYTGKGITVCEQWANSFEAFYADMGPRPSPSHSIDRIDNHGNYEPGNCRWATPKVQSNNTSVNQILTFEGRSMTLTAWSEELGLNPSTLFYRINRLGWTVEKALTTAPISKYRRW